jgi:hypothetical protein
MATVHMLFGRRVLASFGTVPYVGTVLYVLGPVQ